MGNIMVIDAATGRQIPLARYDAQKIFGKPPSASGAGDEISGGNYSPALLQKAIDLNVTPQELARAQVFQDAGWGTINPQMFGEIRLPLDTFPYGVDIGTGEAIQTPRSKEPINQGLAKRLAKDDLASIAMSQSYIPPGGQLNPRAFTKYKDKTILALISETAEMYDVPVELLYGLINAESGFVTNAMTPDGTRVGLAQIDLLRYPHISMAQATNPLFAVRWAGRELRMNANKYGGWEGAIASQVDPTEAEFLARTGQFNNPGTKVFVEDIYGYANSSGIGRYMFDPDKIAKTASRGGGGGGGGVKLPAYQAPDPNALAQIARSTYKDMMGREPTEEEAAASAARLNELFKEKYNSDIARIQGKSSTAVDPQASYEEGIRGLGEFEFREESRGTKDMMDFMGSIVSIMQGV
jgi:soluble lytic murein transglycosylase-like protein